MNREKSSSEKTSWKKLGCGLSKESLGAVRGLGFLTPTPIQVHAIPTFLSKKDIVAQAVTGSGKTLAFIIPIMELHGKVETLKSTDIFAIILSPTTELAGQTYDMFNNFLVKYSGEKPLVKLYKSGSEVSETTDNKGIIIISTPGVLSKALDNAVQGSMLTKSLKTLEVLIMDEADRLLEMGFSSQLYSIIKPLPKQRLTGLFSATQTTEVEDLIRTGMRNPVRVSIKVTKGHSTGLNDNLPKNLTNYHMTVDCEEKMDVLIRFLKDNIDKKILVFFATCFSVDYFNKILINILKKHKILCMHRKLKSKRNKVFQEFKALEKGVMLCTDVMARGIDIPNIDWVIQFDPPKCATNFVHRCGRTARCDQIGQTLLMLQPNEHVYLDFLTRNQNVEMEKFKPTFNVAEIKSHHKIIQDMCIRDRLVYEKSVRAFVSYIEYYKKHELKYIFKLTDLNLGKLGNSFGLIRMPQMRELNDVDQSDFKKSDVDLSTLVYKDKSVRLIKDKTRVIKQERRKIEAEEALKEGFKSKKDIKKEKDLKKSKRAAKKNKKLKKNSAVQMDIDTSEVKVTDNLKGEVTLEKKFSIKENQKQENVKITNVIKDDQNAPKINNDHPSTSKVPIKRKLSIPTEGSGLLSFVKKTKL